MAEPGFELGSLAPKPRLFFLPWGSGYYTHTDLTALWAPVPGLYCTHTDNPSELVCQVGKLSEYSIKDTAEATSLSGPRSSYLHRGW